MHILYDIVKCTFTLKTDISDKQNINEVDGLGRTALMYAVHFGHLDTVQLLLEHGIDLNAAANGKQVGLAKLHACFRVLLY